MHNIMTQPQGDNDFEVRKVTTEKRYHEMLDELHRLIGHGMNTIARERVKEFVKEAGVELTKRDERGKVLNEMLPKAPRPLRVPPEDQ